MDMFDFAGLLFGGNRNRSEATTVTASGAASSEDGVASITLDADVTPAEDVGEDADQTIIDLPTSPDVDEGDELIVTLVGDGPLKTPVVTANPGSGDRMRALANSAKTVANAAQAVADAINQHFWHDTNGAHVTMATQEEWEQSHSGPNSLWNSLGMLFRDGLNNLLALVTGQETGVAIYDGNGNDPENVVASFTGTNVSLGANSDSSTIDMCGGMWNVSVDTSDPVIPVATIKANGSASAAQNVTPTLRMVSQADYGTYSVEYGVEVQTNDGIQYPVSIVHNGDRVIGFGTLGMQTPGLTLTNSTGSTVRAPYGIHMITATGTNSWSTAPGTVLWSGAYHMTASHTASLTYNVSTCHTGIVLHWQAYVNGSAANQDQCYCFVPKSHVANFAGGGVQMPLMTSGFGKVGCKYVYVYDDRVAGAANNNQSGTASGITYDNSYWVLTQIIAV